LFQFDVSPLEQQKNNREFELIVQTCIMNTIRDSIPIELLLKQYIDETQEIDVETTEKIVREPETKTDVSSSETEPETKNNASIDDNKTIDTVESVFSDSNKNEVVGEKVATSSASESVSFKDLPDMTTSELNTSTPKMDPELENTEIISLDDDTSDITNDVLKIGEDVPLKLDTDFDNNANVEPELQEATLNIEESPIDLGIEELTI
jgi:metal-dependent amidase/aminoacylase/carboxypeptidase family protein